MLYTSDAVFTREHELCIAPRCLGKRQVEVSLWTHSEEPIGGKFQLTFGPAEVSQAAAGARQHTERYIARSQQALPPDPLRELGERLFEGVFEGRRKVVFDRAMARAREAGMGLRVRVMTPNAESAEDAGWLPWEYLYDSRRTDFLALSMLSRVVRDVGRPPDDVISLATPPLRALVLGADITGNLGVADEIGQIEQIASLNSSLIQIKAVRDVNKERFLSELKDGDYHILHFIGTGAATSQGPAGRTTDNDGLAVLAPANETSNGQVVGSDEFLDAIKHKHRLRLALFDACDTHGIAARVAQVVPATVGLRGLVSIKACETFFLEIYRQVLAGESLDTAVTAARQRIDRQLTGSREWGLMTFHLQTPDGQFVRWPRGRSGQEAESVATVFEKEQASKPASRKRKLARAILKRNLALLRERAAGDVPEVVRQQLDEAEGRLRAGQRKSQRRAR